MGALFRIARSLNTPDKFDLAAGDLAIVAQSLGQNQLEPQEAIRERQEADRGRQEAEYRFARERQRRQELEALLAAYAPQGHSDFGKI